MMAIAELARPAHHAWRNIDTIDTSGRSNSGAQERKVSSVAAPDLEDAIPAFEAQAIDCMFAQARRNAEQPIEQRNHVGEAIVALSDEIRVAIHPLISHASPLYLQPGLRSRPTQPSATAANRKR
jgi:hypothetical protein